MDRRRAATHGRYAELLARRYPEVTVDADVLYVDDGQIPTSAGSAAGLDLCVHIVRTDFGPSIANAVARRPVIALHRSGGQAQLIEAPVARDLDDDHITESMAWALSNLGRPITVVRLAARAHTSTRTYLRQFKRCSRTSPIRWLIGQRVQASLPLLETTKASIEEIAAARGSRRPPRTDITSPGAMRTSPSAYRRAFRDSASTGDEGEE